jgi:RHH-type proline utilization regulon transcriptional repressor/proline dehydrogenase/delta 1-pyrroline-5-carboxylate dehydrogenase
VPDTPQNRQWANEISLPAQSYDFVADAALDKTTFDAVLFEGGGDALQTFVQRVAERSVSINTAAAGGNAKLMTIG